MRAMTYGVIPMLAAPIALLTLGVTARIPRPSTSSG
jgi:hypothetical protein